MTAQTIEFEEVNLDAMTTEELLRERADVMAAIPMIDAQLKDKERRPQTPEDDSPAWDEYRDWRRRARWAFAHHKADLVQIRNILSERKDINTAKARMQGKLGTPPPSFVLGEERYARMQEVLSSQTTDSMLLWSYRIIRRLLADHVNSLPDSLNGADREHLIALGLHIRQTYGTGRIKTFCDSPDGVLS